MFLNIQVAQLVRINNTVKVNKQTRPLVNSSYNVVSSCMRNGLTFVWPI